MIYTRIDIDLYLSKKQTNPLEIMLRQIVLFAFNYNRQDIIEKIWADDKHMASHLRMKFDGYGQRYKNNVELFLIFVSELSSDKIQEVEDYITNNPL